MTTEETLKTLVALSRVACREHTKHDKRVGDALASGDRVAIRATTVVRDYWTDILIDTNQQIKELAEKAGDPGLDGSYRA